MKCNISMYLEPDDSDDFTIAKKKKINRSKISILPTEPLKISLAARTYLHCLLATSSICYYLGWCKKAEMSSILCYWHVCMLRRKTRREILC